MPSEMETFNRDLLESVKQMRHGQAARVTRVKVPKAAEARSRVGLSQQDFARLLGVSARTLQDWEQAAVNPQAQPRRSYESPSVIRKYCLNSSSKD